MTNYTFIIGLFVAKINLDAMLDYLHMMEDYSRSSLDDFREKYEEEFKKRTSLEVDSITREDFLLSRKKGFLQHLLANFIVSWYSFVEQEMMHICESLDLKISIGVKDNPSFGKGIFRVRKFLKESTKYDIDKDTWDELIGVNRLRNFIVHQGLDVVGKYDQPAADFIVRTFKDGRVLHFQIEKNFLEYLIKHNLIEETHSNYSIVPTFDYCRELIEFAQKLFKDLYWDLDPLNRDD